MNQTTVRKVAVSAKLRASVAARLGSVVYQANQEGRAAYAGYKTVHIRYREAFREQGCQLV